MPAQERTHSVARFGLVSRATLLLWSAAVLAAVVASPLAASAGRGEGWFLYEAFEAVCHQQPERSWHLQGQPLAVCVRCFGLYAGLLFAALPGLRLPLKLVAAALALVGLSWAAESSGLVVASEETRFASGLVLGLSLCAAVLETAAMPHAQSARRRAAGA